MDKKYTCKICNYVTERSRDLKRHLASNKHKRKISSVHEKSRLSDDNVSIDYENCTECAQHSLKTKKAIGDNNSAKTNNKKTKVKILVQTDYECKYCKKKFKDKSSMYRHCRKFCDVAKTIQDKKDLEILKLKEENKKVIELTEQNKKLIDTVNKNADTVNVAVKSTNRTISTLHYAMKNLKDAPPIKLLEGHTAIGLIGYDDPTKRPLGEWLVFHQEKESTSELIGDMIIKAYKKENPNEQSFWTTDASRLSFIVMQLFGKTGDTEWGNDKSGLKIRQLIIRPLLQQIGLKLIEYKDKCEKEYFAQEKEIKKKGIYMGERDILKEHMKRNIYIDEIIYNIKNKTLENGILKYIAPSFGLNSASIEIETIKCIKCKKEYDPDNGTICKKGFVCLSCIDKFFE